MNPQVIESAINIDDIIAMEIPESRQALREESADVPYQPRHKIDRPASGRGRGRGKSRVPAIQLKTLPRTGPKVATKGVPAALATDDTIPQQPPALAASTGNPKKRPIPRPISISDVDSEREGKLRFFISQMF